MKKETVKSIRRLISFLLLVMVLFVGATVVYAYDPPPALRVIWQEGEHGGLDQTGTCHDYGDYITNVTLSKDGTNILVCGDGIEDTSNNWHTDFGRTSPQIAPVDVIIGQTYQISVTVTGDDLIYQHLSVYIDWNQDQKNGVLSEIDPNEEIAVWYNYATGSGTKLLTKEFTVPTGIPIGKAYMRVILDADGGGQNGGDYTCGIGYGEFEDYVLNVSSGNTAPTATSVQISGTAQVGQTLTGSYDYADADSDAQGTSTFKWYRSNDAGGAGKVQIAGALNSTYTLASDDVNKYISFEVTPVAAAGTSPGTAVESGRVGPVTLPEITAASVTVTAPVLGAVPQNAAAVEGATSNADYTVTSVTWNEALVNGKFKADQTYTATIVLTSKNGKQFQAGAFTPTVAGAASVGTTTTAGTGAGNTVSFTVTYAPTGAKEVTGITVKTQPTDLTYIQGENLDLTGLEATLTYSDTSTEDVALADFAAKGITATPANGTAMTVAAHNGNAVTISCNGQQASTSNLTVTLPEITAASVTVTAPVLGAVPQNAAAVEGATSNADYTVTSVTWNEALVNGKFKADQTYTATIVLTSKNGKQFQAGAFTPAVAGAASVGTTTTAGTGAGNTVTFTVTYAPTGAKAVTGITVKTQPTDLTYIQGENLDLTGLEVTLTYNDTSTEDVALADFAGKGITASPANGTAITVAAHNGNAVTISCNGQQASTSNLTVTLPEITAASVTVTAPVLGAVPQNAAAVEGATSNADYTVTSVTWNEALVNGKFKAGQAYTATIVLTSKNSKQFQAAAFTPTVANSSSVGTTTTTNTGEGNTVSFTVTYAPTGAKEVTGIAVKTQPTDLTYIQGENLDLTGLEATLTYNDTSTEDVVLADFAGKGITASPANGTAMTVAAHNGHGVTLECSGEQTATDNLTVTLPEITAASVTVTAPVLGAVPQNAAAVEGATSNADYTVTSVTWNEALVNGKFKAGQAYTATIVLTSKNGKQFQAAAFTPAVAGAASVGTTTTAGTGEGNTVSFTVTYAPTGTKAVTGITVKTQPTDLTYIQGENLDLTGLEVTLTYNDTSTEDVALADFAGKGITASPANGTAITVAAHNGNAVTISCNGQQASTSNLTVTLPEITAASVTVTAPVLGAVPQNAAAVEGATSNADYTVTSVTWNEALVNGKFKADQTYTATIVLTSKNGKQFQAGAFTPAVAGAASVGTTTTAGTGAGNTVTFTVTYAPTGAKAVTGITVKTQPTDLTYIQGENLDLTGLEATLTYNDTSTEDVALADFAGKGITTTPANGTAITVAAHNGHGVTLECSGEQATTDNLTVTLPEITAASVTVTAPVLGAVPQNAAAVEGATSNADYTVTSVTWNEALVNGKFKAGQAYTATIVLTSKNGKQFQAAAFTPTVVNSASVGTTTTAGTGVGNTVTFTVTYAPTGAKAVTGITVKTQPTDLTYIQGENLDLTGLEATLTYSDTSTEDVALADFAAKGITATPANGTAMTVAAHNGNAVTISCNGQQASTSNLTVTLPEITAASVTVTAPVLGAVPQNAAAVEGATSNADYTVTSVTWNEALVNGKFKADQTYTATIVLTSKNGKQFQAGAFTPAVAGAASVGTTTTAGTGAGNTVTFTVTYAPTGAKAVTGITVKTQPTDLTYIQGENLDLTGLEVTLTYNDTSTEDVALADFAGKGITASPANGTAITVAAHNGNAVTISCNGQQASTSNLTVTLPEITAASVTVTAPVLGAVPQNAAAVEGATSNADYTVTGITWNEALTAGGKFKAGQAYTATIVLTSKNGKQFQAGAFTPAVAGAASVGTTTTAGTGAGNTVSFTVTYAPTGAKAVTGITVKTQPTDLTYTQGESLDLTGLEVTLTYDDSSTEDVAFADFAGKGIIASPANGTAMAVAAHNGHGVMLECNGQKAATSNLTVNPVPTYSIEFIGNQTMTGLTAGYAAGTQQTKTITVTMAGTGILENMAVAISGNSFDITQPVATTLSGATQSTTFTVKARNGLAGGTYTETVTVSADNMVDVTFTVTQTITTPGIPAIISAEEGDGHVYLIWNDVTNAERYDVYLSTQSGSYGTVCDTVYGAVYSSSDITGLTNGETYYFAVNAINPDESSIMSSQVSASPKTVPGAPTNVTAIAGNGHAVISFTVPGNNGGRAITKYIVTSSPDNISVEGTASPITVTGLTNGTSYTFTIKAFNEAGAGRESQASNVVTPRAPSSGGGSDGSSTPTTPAPERPSVSGVEILVNGKTETAATAVTTKEDDKTVITVTVDDKKVEEKLQSEGDRSVVTIPVNDNSDVVVGQLNGQTVKNMEAKEAVLEIKTENVTYTLPAAQMNIDSVSEQIGSQVELKDITVNVKVSSPPDDTVKIVEETANRNNYQIVVKPVEFEITCTSGSRTVEVSKFNGYVERTVAIPEGIDPSRITTGIVLNPDGTFSHVPTTIININGKYFAKINSLTNSTYSVIWSPKTFADVDNHWAKEEVNDMGSRLVINGVGDSRFEPERDITRAEFAAIIVKALGLMRSGTGKNVYSDVTKGEWYYNAVSIANEYGIISGYGNDKFGPNDRITREQTMTMIARAMKITGLKAEFKESEVEKLLSEFSDSTEGSAWARESMAACVSSGIVSGKGGTLIAPADNITRAEVAAIVRRLLQKSDLID
ncbi:S-layer homology domain-containing protein [Petroclostridium sp. X23]|uniref:S-layer homology domain-containing protein n=1 Tax=Petroclostridium sp. X23 TaxID=3045146 RepID=UPI0024ADE561|nr:S-layer homology domain-containing protein [Petroclostridium sp. X23]WHH61336.1 S-layer homology domain-containing protein [Petroclostridium sp. X23]